MFIIIATAIGFVIGVVFAEFLGNKAEDALRDDLAKAKEEIHRLHSEMAVMVRGGRKP